MPLRFTELPAADTAADYLARCVADDLRAVLDRKPRAVLAVSGGKSPVPFFHALSRADLDWPRVGIVLADERLVPNDHADSNAALVRRHLLQNRAASAVFVPMVADGADEGSLNNGQAAAASAAERVLPPEHLPRRAAVCRSRARRQSAAAGVCVAASRAAWAHQHDAGCHFARAAALSGDCGRGEARRIPPCRKRRAAAVPNQPCSEQSESEHPCPLLPIAIPV